MWTRQILGTDVYHLVSWFILYSMLGWLVESIYMSFCNKKITNRGFAKGPFCPIYGFGALGAYYILQPMSGHFIGLYISGAVLATFFEYLVARLMDRVFGEVWWDYSDKPFNYKGIICLESSLGWGLLGIIYFRFLNGFLMRLAGFVPHRFEKRLAVALVLFYLTDFLWCLRHQIKNRGEEQEQVIGRLSVRP